MIVGLASPRPASDLDGGLENVRRLLSGSAAQRAEIVCFYALRFQESATSPIAPSGRCQAYLPYGREGLLVEEIDLEKATGLLARRYAPERYRELQETPA